MICNSCSPTAYEIVPLPNGDTIMAAVVDGECFFSPRHVCEEMGLGWSAQRVKIMADPVLSEAVSMIDTPSAGASSAP